MAMRPSTVRFPELLWEYLEEEAARDGISVAQFIRDSALLRLGYRWGQLGRGEEVEDLFRKVYRSSPPD